MSSLRAQTLCGAFLLLTVGVVAGGCGSSSSPSDSVESVHLHGAAEKGPFVLGSSVSVSAVTAHGDPTGAVFPTETISDLGAFELSIAYRGPVSLEASGYYFNEVTGALSRAPLTLRGWYEVSDESGQTANLNVITHLTNRRVRWLLARDASVATAIAQAESELTEALGVAHGDTNARGSSQDVLDSPYLFAVSAVLAEAGRTRGGEQGADSSLQELLNQVASDLEQDGTLSRALRAEVDAAQQSLDPAEATANLAKRMHDLGHDGSPPDLGSVLDSDLDGVVNDADNCVALANPQQTDSDADGVGDACDSPEPPLLDAGMLEDAGSMDAGHALDDAGNALFDAGSMHAGDAGEPAHDGGSAMDAGTFNVIPNPLSAGGLFTCLLKDGTVRCWGLGSVRGVNATQVPPCYGNGDSPVPTEIAGLTDAVALSRGSVSSTMCAVVSGGGVACWPTLEVAGEPQLPHDVCNFQPKILRPDRLTHVVQVALGSYACALRDDGTVLCWGDSGLTTPLDGELRAVPDLDDAVEIASGNQHTCVRRRNGTVSCWGQGGDGQLADGNGSAHAVSQLVTVAGVTDVVQLAAGQDFTCALESNGHVVCWGHNNYGQTGTDSSSVVQLPVTVQNLDDAVQISAGFGTGCAVRRGGAVVCWGYGAHGQLGGGTMPTDAWFHRDTPGLVGVSDALAVVAGQYHVCAARPTGIDCWGSNLEGELAQPVDPDAGIIGSLTPVHSIVY